LVVDSAREFIFWNFGNFSASYKNPLCHRISEFNAAYDPQHFPLMFLRREAGWNQAFLPRKETSGKFIKKIQACLRLGGSKGEDAQLPNGLVSQPYVEGKIVE
jgi:hypothetical protein